MKILKKSCNRFVALAMTLALVLSMGTVSAFAATTTPESTVSPYTVISSMGNKTCTAYVYSPYSDNFVVRANKTIVLTINIVSKTNDAAGFFYQLINTAGGPATSQEVKQSGSTTLNITIPQGGTYYFLFGCMKGSYTFNYTIKI